jgi:hypothetical protein
MASLRRKVIRLREVVQRQIRHQLDFVKYEDTRAELASRRQQAYYNLGFERGHFAGLVDSSSPKHMDAPALRAFRRQISSAVAEANLPKGKIVAALLDFTKAVALSASRGASKKTHRRSLVKAKQRPI